MLHLTNPKYCWAWNRVYVKANGRVPCWCDSGEPYTIVHKSLDSHDFICDIVNSPEMLNMRSQILINNKYYIDECKTCCCMYEIDRGQHSRFAGEKLIDIQDMRNKANKMLAKHTDRPYGWINNISEIQIEPSFPCNLRCPGCLQGRHQDPLSTEPPPYILPLLWFKKIIDSITLNYTRLHRIAFVGRGEPTLNKSLSNMIDYARHNIPEVVMSMDTNANQQFHQSYTKLDWINCSIDGSDQHSYSQYRKGGEFSKAVQFMLDGTEAGANIRWKYILFNVSDNDKQLDEAQRLAYDIGIDELMFVITHTGGGNIKPSSKYLTVEDVNTYIDNHKIFDNTTATYAT